MGWCKGVGGDGLVGVFGGVILCVLLVFVMFYCFIVVMFGYVFLFDCCWVLMIYCNVCFDD